MSIVNEIRNRILEEANENYKKFMSNTVPDCDNIAGVRIPVMRKIAKDIYKSDWENYLSNKDYIFMEEKMIKSFVIGHIKDSPEKILYHIENFIPEIDNWAVCDCFCCSLKFINKNKPIVWDFLQKYLNSKKEYEIRFAVVILLSFFIDEEYIEKVLNILENLRTDDYYAQMAIAWAISICFVKFETETREFLIHSQTDNKIYNKAIQKIIESNRVSGETKSKLKLMKR